VSRVHFVRQACEDIEFWSLTRLAYFRFKSTSCSNFGTFLFITLQHNLYQCNLTWPNVT
jgi:hypothetical protein